MADLDTGEHTELRTAVEVLERAAQLDRDQQYQEALALYTQGIERLLLASKGVSDDDVKRRLHTKAGEYLDRAESIKKRLGGEHPKEKQPKKNLPTPYSRVVKVTPSWDPWRPTTERHRRVSEEIHACLRTWLLIAGRIPISADVKRLICHYISTAKGSWDTLTGCESQRRCMMEGVLLPLLYPQFFKGARRPFRTYLLFGPPGCGKSTFARELAREANCYLIELQCASLFSWYAGVDAERTIRQVFKEAAANAPAIILVDECDALDTQLLKTKSARRVRTEFLVQMNSVQENVFVIGTTAFPDRLANAVRRRYDKRLYFPPPDEESRTQWFRTEISKEEWVQQMQKDELERLVALTEHFTYADLNTSFRDVLMEPARKVQCATHFTLVGSKYTPCPPEAPGAVEMSWEQLQADQLLVPTIDITHFERILPKFRPSVLAEDLLLHEEFNSLFGPN